MKNHESRPTGSAPFPDVNAALFNGHSFDHGRGKGCNYNYKKIQVTTRSG